MRCSLMYVYCLKKTLQKQPNVLMQRTTAAVSYLCLLMRDSDSNNIINISGQIQQNIRTANPRDIIPATGGFILSANCPSFALEVSVIKS